MTTLTLRLVKGTELTWAEVDSNFTSLRDSKLEASSNLSDLINTATARVNIGLGNVSNTSDANKPVSTAQQTALNLKANINSPTFTGTVAGITAAMVGAPSGSGSSSGSNTGDSAVNSLYVNDYRAANFVAGTNYQTPLTSGVDYQAPLVSGTSIKTINSVPLVGSGDITSVVMVYGAQTVSDKTLVNTIIAPGVGTAVGELNWNSNDSVQTLDLVMAGGAVVQQIGEEFYYRIKAGVAITNGQVVMNTGTQGASGAIIGAPATGVLFTNSHTILGIATEDIALNGWGYVTAFGVVRGIDTTGTAVSETWVDGDVLYYNPAIVGTMTKVVPIAPNPKTKVATVIHAAANTGSLLVRLSYSFSLENLADVESATPSNSDLLQYTTNKWQHIPAANINVGSATILETGRTISLTGDVTGTSGTFNGSGNISFATTIAANSVALGTDTTGNYVASMTAGTGITVGTATGEGSTPVITNTAPNVTTNLSTTTTATTLTVVSSDGTNALLPAATTTIAGVLTGADKTKLDGAAASAHKYHAFANGQYFFDTYEQGNYFRLFTENAVFDTIRFGTITTPEYFDYVTTNTFVAWTGAETSISNILDGREETGMAVAHANRKFRFVVTRNSGWPTTALLLLQTTWTGMGYPSMTVTLETGTTASGAWAVKETAVFNSTNTANNWGCHIKASSGLHDGAGFMRVTIDITDWTDSGAYTTVPLRRLCYFSNYSGAPQQPWTWNYARVVNFLATPTAAGSTIWHAGNDGTGSGLDADLLDGQNGSYYLDWTNTTNKPDPVVTVTLTGDVTGTANTTLTDLASGTISVATTIAANSVALGTDTTGNYVASMTAGTGITVGTATGEGSIPVITNTAPNVTTNLSTTTTATTVTVVSSDGTNAILPAATTTVAGVLTGADKTKLDGLANYVLPAATITTLGGIELEDATVQTVAANTVTATAGRTYGLQVNAAGQGVINVPWVDNNTTYSAATTTTPGLIELEDATVQTVAANIVTATAGRTYGLQVNAAGQGVINVPWVDNNTTNLSYTTAATTGTVNSSTGTNATIPAATIALAGLMTDADKTKLDGIAVGATNVTNTNQLTNGAGYSTTTGTVTSVGNGNGMNFTTFTTTGTVTLGTPSTLTAATTNALTASSHTHAITGFALDSHNHTTLTGITSLGFAAEGSDSASITTTINASGTYFDFNLTDDNNNDWWRWRFTPSGSTIYDAMTLKPVANGLANLTVSGTVSGSNLSGTNTGDNAGVTSVAIANGTGISVTGGPITTSGTLTITNTAPNVTTNLSTTTTATTLTVVSSDGTNALLPAATTTVAGVLTGADKTKLDGIAAGAQVNVATNLGYTTAASTGTVTSSTGTNATVPAATISLAGLLTGADKTKLDGIAAGATTNTGTVTSVGNGNGMNFTTFTTTGTVALGTPSTLTAATTNALTASSHTHAITGFALDSHAHSYLPLAGGTMTGNVQYDSGSSPYIYDSAIGGRIPAPGGAAYLTSTPEVTGAIKIALPTNAASDMMGFEVNIFDYASNESVKILINGYTYLTTTPWWYNCQATVISSNSTKDYTVRFGYDGSKNCVWIGELADTWAYPQVAVFNFHAGYSTTIASYASGWSVSFVTAFDSVGVTVSTNFPEAETATTLRNARTIGMSGVTATATSFDGSANITIPVTAVPATLLTGTIADARISGSYTGMTNLTGTGTVDFAKFAGLATDLVSTPSFTWTGDLTTGFYRPAASQVAVAIAGVQRALVTATGITATNLSGTNTGDNPGVTSVATSGGYGGLTLTGGTITSTGTITMGGTPTGTWPISVSGNARSILFVDGPRNLSDRLPSSEGLSVKWDFVGASTTGTGGNFAGVMTFAPWTGTTASTGDASYQLAFGSTASNGGGIPHFRIRKGIDSTWNSWYDIWHAGNLTNLNQLTNGPGYVSSSGVTSVATSGGYGGLTLTGGTITSTGTITMGGTPTGTWPISVSGASTSCSGNAASASTVTATSASQNGDGWWRSTGNAGWYSTTYAVGIYATEATNVRTYNGANFIAAGNVTAYSDSRLKENINVIPNALGKVLAIRGVTYTRNDMEDKTKVHTGVIAQEVLAVFPEAVMLARPDDYYTVAYGNMVGLLIEAIKEQQEIIDSQEARISRLEALINKIV